MGAREGALLSRIISTVGSSLELEEVLAAVVGLLSDASAVHACFVYLVDESGDRLVLSAASEPYAALTGQVSLERGEGLAWWSAERREPAFVPDNLLDDPRVKYVPELDEDKFQSLLTVPIVGKDDKLVGVIVAHTEAPREFTDEEVDVVVAVASLVAGAIDNARLYEETRRQVRELEELTKLAEEIAESRSLEGLLPLVAARAREILGASTCHLYLLDGSMEELVLQASKPSRAQTRERIGLAELGPELARGGRASRVSVPLVAGDELLGLLVAEDSAKLGLARGVASQAAVGIKKVQLIERLTEENAIRDFFGALAAGAPPADLRRRATGLGLDLDHDHVVVVAEHAGEPLGRALAGLAPGAVWDRREKSLTAVLPVPATGADRLVASVRQVQERRGSRARIGISSPCAGSESCAGAFVQARQALLGTVVLRGEPPVVAYEELGAFKYLLRLTDSGIPRDATIEAVAKLADYDRERGAQLLATLEEFLARHGSVSAASDALYVHPNTLRQRLRRIAEISGLDLRHDDWLMVEIAVKLVRLAGVLAERGERPGRPG